MYRTLILLLVLILDFYWFVYLSGLISFTDGSDLTNWFTLSIEIVLGLYVAIGVTTYFHKKEDRVKKNKTKFAMKQIFDRFVYVMTHVKYVDKKIREYYELAYSIETQTGNTENLKLSRKQCENGIVGLKKSATGLENSLILLAGDLDYKMKSGLRFFLDVIENNTELFNNQFSDMEKLNGLIGNANATKERLSKYDSELFRNSESELEELTKKIKSNIYTPEEILDFIWKE